MIPDSFIKELVANTDIVELISEYIKLKRSGRNHLGLCPFHSEKTPSFSVNSEKGFFHCFGCGIGGDAITFIRQIENMEYIEAVKFLADRAGMKVPEDSYSQDTDLIVKQNLRILEMNRIAAKYFYRCLFEDIGKVARNYLANRGIDSKLATKFGLGFAPGNIKPLFVHLETMGYSKEEMVLANLAIKKNNGDIFDRFYNRLMFPIIDKRGNVIAFGGRTLNNGTPKYLNSSDTNVYKKSENLYAINIAKTATSDSFILAEGYMDVIALHSAGFTNAVASLGTALTQQQAKLISRYTREVIIAYDSDEAGKKAATRAIPILRQAGLNVRVLNLGSAKDPDEYIKSNKDGAVRFKKLLEDSQNDVEYMLQKLKEPYDLEQNNEKIEYLKNATLLLSKLDNKIEREIYASYLSEQTEVDKNTILLQIENSVKEEKKKRRIVKSSKIKMKNKKDAYSQTINIDSKIRNTEEALLAYIFDNPEDFEYISKNISTEHFISNDNKKVFENLLVKYKKTGNCDFNLLLQELDLNEASRLATVFSKNLIVNKTRQDANQYIKTIKNEFEKNKLKNTKDLDDKKLKEYIAKLREEKNRRH